MSIQNIPQRRSLITTFRYLIGDIMSVSGYVYKCEICDEAEADSEGRKEYYSYWTLLNPGINGN